MEDSFYTNVYQHRGKIYLRGYQGNKRVKEVVKYKPYVFRPQEGGFYRTIDGTQCDKVHFESIRLAKDYLEQFKEVDNVTTYGLTNFPYLFIYDNYPGEIQFDPLKVSVASIDIECAADEGFPNIQLADKEITAIALRSKGKSIAFGCGNFVPKDDTVTYVKCKHETELLTKFLDVWEQMAPDVVTGWNIDFFDFPYLINRIRNILGPDAHKRLSPWGFVEEKTIEFMKKQTQTYIIAGISILDYYQLYRKFTFGNAESYKLNYIAHIVLGEHKIDYSEFGSLLNLYKQDFQKFMEYNIHDAVLVDRLEEKLGFIKQVIAMAMDAKVNYNDTFTTVRAWDIIIHNYLLDRRIVIPPNTSSKKTRKNIGGYVKEPNPGLYKWVVSFDLKSSYPHNIMQYNISPETLIGKRDIPSIEEIISKRRDIRQDFNINGDYAVAGNGCFFKKDKQGFLPALMEKMYNDRAMFNAKLALLEEEYERTKDKSLLNDISKYNNMQMAKKIQLNSAYGALANEFFRWFDIDLAEAITSSGQLAVIWVATAINLYMNKLLKTTNVDYIIASDTDSVYINMGELAKKLSTTDAKKITAALDTFSKTKLEPFIAESFDKLAEYMNVYKQCMSMTRETIAEKGIWTGKKRYILNVWDKKGVKYDKPKLKVTGIESVRSSTPHVCRDKINEALRIIMNEDEETLQEFIANFKEEFRKLPFEEVAFPRGVNGMLEYADAATLYRKGTPIQVKGSLIFNKLLKEHGIETIQPIADGDKIRFAYLKEPNTIHHAVIAAPDFLPKEFNLDKYIDRDLQFDKSFVEPLRTITGVLNWNVEPVATLASFF
ncbi:MAG: 3'-5' exonuclease [Candidatus Bathyarchaeia archaeon]